MHFPLRGALRRITDVWRREGSLGRRVAIDLGCGTGPALPLLARHFRLVIGIDFAPGMLAASFRRVRECRHETVLFRKGGGSAAASEITKWAKSGWPREILLAQADLHHLEPLDQTADVALAINSFVPPSKEGTRPLFRALARVTRPRGTAILVLPALDGLAYLLELNRRHRQATDPVGFVGWEEGIVRDESGLAQKYYLPDEIRRLLGTHRFRVARMERIKYPWPIADASGRGFFPARPRIWDWYVEAIRSSSCSFL